ncbi:molecule interacting with CasL [Brevipalpus obovatus]|uniref:molecule interacting with CasL n=1 Tax=Brevipalpus obovatus TaxID=246614 RepID=UPI003D9F3C13
MSKNPTDNPHVTELFDEFITASTLKSVLTIFRRIYSLLDLEPGRFTQFYPILKQGIACSKNWKSQSIFAKIEKKASNKIYHHTSSSSNSGRLSAGSNTNNILKNHNCLVIGGGPCGLRSAIELQLLGAEHVVVIEKRDRFSRNNVLHLWPFVIADLKQLAGKKFYGKFCAGSIDHVSIRQLQLMLLKIALIIGCEFIENITFEEMCPRNLVNENLKSTDHENSPPSNIDTGNAAVSSSTYLTSLEAKSSSSSSSSSNKKSFNHNNKRKLSTTVEENIKDRRDESSERSSNHDGGNSGNDSMINGHNSCTTSKERGGSSCECCCHLHQGKSGRNFWSHISKNYIGSYAHFSLTSPPSQHTLASTPPATSGNSVAGNYHQLYNSELLLDKLRTYPFDILIGGDGRRNTLNDNFPRKEFRGKLAIAITANFINNHTLAEAQIPEISGISFIYNQEMFKSLYDDTGIDLENICYYKDDTHYFVMTAKKSSLLQRGVLRNDFSDTRALLAPDNIDRQQLLEYARDAAKWTTGLNTPSFALNHYGEADVAMFDFTSMYAADNACRAKRIVRVNHRSEMCTNCYCDNGRYKNQDCDNIHHNNNHMNSHYRNSGSGSHNYRNGSPHTSGEESEAREGLLVIGLVGDSLLEPFWPTGSGCGRGFLSAMDAAWMVRQWAVNKCRSIKDEDRILQVLSERESIYRLLAQSTSENLSQNFASYTINPVTRYPKLNSTTLLPHQCKHLLFSHLAPPAEPKSRHLTMAEKRARRATIATTSPFSVEVSESHRRVEREFSAINKMKEQQLENQENESFLPVSRHESNSNVAREYQDSLAAFEENYRGLMSSVPDENQLSGCAPNALLSSSVPDCPNPGLHDLSLSPSASNLLTIGKSRARDIESAFRHRRQRQACLKRSEDYDGSGGRAHQKAQQQCMNHLRQQLRSKAAWLLDQKSENDDSGFNQSGKHPREKRGSFNDRIKDLEAKLYAASGISYLSDENADSREEPVRLPSTQTGVKVMMTVSQLQTLLSSKFQEEKLRQEAKTKANKDIKFVGKITKDDWNVKCFEKSSQDKAVPVKTVSPPPPQRLELFRDKLNEIQTKLEHVDDHHRPDRKSKNSKNKGEYISLLKSELTERTSQGKGDLLSKDCKKNPKEIATKRELKSLAPEKIVSSKLCAKCGNIGAPVDKIIIGGTLFHRSCLKCIKCGVALRLSEVRNTGTGSMATLLSGSNRDSFNYQCTNCMNNLTNSIKSTKNSLSSAVTVTDSDKLKSNEFSGSKPSVDSRRIEENFKEKELPFPQIPERVIRTYAAPQVFISKPPINTVNDDYEARLKERIKWKEQFLLNNNNVDLSGVVKGVSDSIVGGSEGDSTRKNESPDSKAYQLSERMEYENTNNTDILLDEEELKAFNQWDSEADRSEDQEDEESEEKEETLDEENDEITSSSDSYTDSDSTDNDFDSNEFDEGKDDSSSDEINRKNVSSFSKNIGQMSHRKSNSNKITPPLLVPQIVVVPDEEKSSESDGKSRDESENEPHNYSHPKRNGAQMRSQSEKKGGEAEAHVKKNTPSKERGISADTLSSDSDTLNDKGASGSMGKFSDPTLSTTYEELQFRKICEEIENCSPSSSSSNKMSPKKDLINPFNTHKKVPLATGDSDDDTKTSLSSLSINASETFDDIDLSSVWEESGNELKGKRYRGRFHNNKKPSHQQSSSKTPTASSKKNPSPKDDPKKSFQVLKSKTDNSIPSRLRSHDSTGDRYDAPANVTDKRSEYTPQNKSILSNPFDNGIRSSANVSFNKSRENIPYTKPSIIDMTPKKVDSFSSSPLSNSTFALIDKNSPTEGKENYSKIPVLSARVAAAACSNVPDSTGGSPAKSKPSYTSGYSGSFTEKLLSRCRSSPTIPMLGDSLNRWSASRMQLSSPSKVLMFTQMNSQQKEKSPNSNTPTTRATINKESSHHSKSSPMSKLSSYHKSPISQKHLNHQSLSSLPYADVNETDKEFE